MGGEAKTALRVVAGVLPKLEPLLASELRSLGVTGPLQSFRGGVEFRATQALLWRVAHEARMVEFLRVRVCNRGFARNWGELYHRVVTSPWSAFMTRGKKGRCPRVSVSCDGASDLYHEGAVRDRVTETIAKRLGVPVPAAPAPDEDDSGRSSRARRRAAERPATANAAPAVAQAGRYAGDFGLEDSALGGAPSASHDVFVHINQNQVQLAVNASGDLMHNRGYRVQPVGSPIRETLGAACLRMAAAAIASAERAAGEATDTGRGRRPGGGARGGSHHRKQQAEDVVRPASGAAGAEAALSPRFWPLWDPFCGGGTYVLEALDWHAALLGALPRRFAFEFWPTHDRAEYRQYVSALNEGTGAARPLPYVADVGNDAEPVFLGSDVSGRSIRAAHANFLTALNTSPGGAGRRRALKRLTKFTRGDFQAVEPTVPQGATIVTNVPVGFKTQAGETFHQVYRRFGRMLQKRTDFEHVFVLNKHPDFRRDTGLRWRQLKSFRNGGTVVELLQLVRR